MTDSTLLNQNIDSFVLNKYTLKFNPKNLNNKPEYKLLNKLISELCGDNYEIDFSNQYLTLITLNTTNDIYNYLKSKNLENYVTELLPQQSGHFNKTNKCFINNLNNIVSNDIVEFVVANPILKNNKKTTAIIYNYPNFINVYIDIIRKYILNLVMDFLINKYKNNMNNIYLKESNKYMLIYLLDESPNFSSELSNINFNNYKEILKKHKTTITKIILFKCKINKFIPYINTNKLIDHKIVANINKNSMLKDIIFNSKISLFEGKFVF